MLAAALALDQDLHRAVGKAEQLHHRAERADLEDVVRRGLVGLGVLLRGEEDVLVARHRGIERVDRPLPTDEELTHHVRKYDDVAEREQRNDPRRFCTGRFTTFILPAL